MIEIKGDNLESRHLKREIFSWDNIWKSLWFKLMICSIPFGSTHRKLHLMQFTNKVSWSYFILHWKCNDICICLEKICIKMFLFTVVFCSWVAYITKYGPHREPIRFLFSSWTFLQYNKILKVYKFKGPTFLTLFTIYCWG